MSFQDAVRTCLQRKYADFHGRARRSEYWFFFLFTAIIGVVGGILDAIFDTRSGMYGGTGPIQGILQLALRRPGPVTHTEAARDMSWAPSGEGAR